MKLVIAIVNNDDAACVADELLENRFPATKMDSTGGFLRTGNTTFFVGVEEKDVDRVISIINQHSSRRMQLMSDLSPYVQDNSPSSVQVTVGGATIFVVDVDRFEKL